MPFDDVNDDGLYSGNAEPSSEKKDVTICPSCGSEIDVSAHFCTYCGYPVADMRNSQDIVDDDIILENEVDVDNSDDAVPIEVYDEVVDDFEEDTASEQPEVDWVFASVDDAPEDAEEPVDTVSAPPVTPDNNFEDSEPAPSQSSANNTLHPFVWGLLGALVVVVVAIPLFLSFVPQVESGGSQTITVDVDEEDVGLAEAVAAKALPSVVSILVSNTYSAGAGSGVILDTEGHVLTNHHVIEDASSISVNLDDNAYTATVMGADESSDLAVLQVDFGDTMVQPIELGDSDELEVGDWVMAIGSPFGLDRSVSSGIVSSLYRSTILPSYSGNSLYANLIQTDAAINPGNSGGALVNEQGELVGINSIISSYSGSSSGVGFAIPSNYAVKIANSIIAGKEVEHAYMGVNVQSMTPQYAQSKGIGTPYGAYITSVVEGTPAAACGLQAEDTITQLGDQKIQSADGLILAVRTFDIGEKVPVTFFRGDKEQTVEITLGSDLNIDANGGSSTWNNQLFQNPFGEGLDSENSENSGKDDSYGSWGQGESNDSDTEQYQSPDQNLDEGYQFEFQGSPEELQDLLNRYFQ